MMWRDIGEPDRILQLTGGDPSPPTISLLDPYLYYSRLYPLPLVTLPKLSSLISPSLALFSSSHGGALPPSRVPL